jgi:predicted phosphodiesterase
MRVAVISDVHGNLAALESVLEAATLRADELWCLGDTVGYGPRPNECVAVVREHCSIVLAGNHDLAAAGTIDAATFSADAGRAIRWTREVLMADIEGYLRGLAPVHEQGNVGLYHGSPRDPTWEYVTDPLGAHGALAATAAALVLVGHTHASLAARLCDGRLTGGRANAGAIVEAQPDVRVLLNPGSVGQPRDADARAAWLLLELDDDRLLRRATFERTRYDVTRTQREMLAAGLPEHLADRLTFGI